MSSYEFWDELGKIFNAVVAYQEKNLEFNKRFISPWIRLGNVFEKQDRNKEAMEAYRRAIEIDESNPQNWFELGNIHFKMENHGEAISAFRRAIELDPGFGLAYSNLALTLASTAETKQAIATYKTAIDLLSDPKDRAVAWNRLGNAYRKVNQYEQALEAFHKADELDQENAGFKDSLDDVAPSSESVTEGEAGAAVPSEPDATASPPEPTIDANLSAEDQTSFEVVPEPESAAPEAADTVMVEVDAPMDPSLAPLDAVEPGPENPVEAIDEGIVAEAPPAAVAEPSEADVEPEAQAAGTAGEETVTVVVQDGTQTFTQALPLEADRGEFTATALSAAEEQPTPNGDDSASAEVVTAEEQAHAAPPASDQPSTEVDEPPGEAAPEATMISVPAAAAGGVSDPAPDSLADQLLEAEPEVLDVPQQVAYEEYLKDTNEAVHGLVSEEAPDPEMPGSPEPISKIDETGELQIEMDTKNAHVWNELGNVYFNTSAFDDAIVAYSKAIELDRWFAWPYSNLALAYVQKRRFVEAILLYQRSIELFGNDKDKAISWNRLGNVYRRLNDYENAIAAYQRADALDPDNSTLSLQSRFSLLGNYAMEQKPAYVS